MTFSIIARCAVTGQFGVAIASSSPAVAARCAFARARVGAVATQNVTNPALGSSTLDRLSAGANAEGAVRSAIAEDAFPDYRQLLAVDGVGRTFAHSGRQSLGVWSEAEAPNCAAGGNLLANRSVPAAMADAFDAAVGTLGDRLIGAMQAGFAAGGEAGKVHSAGLLIVDRETWPYAELRCDWTDDDPITAVAAAWEVYKPQADDYVTRALNPTEAPSYGVPGDE